MKGNHFMNCRPGDLAISINTRSPENLGLIVRVVRRHIDTPSWNFHGEPTWWCVCEQPMTWHFLPTPRIVKAHEGPVPDACLRPIRGDAGLCEDALTNDLQEEEVIEA